jgi:hypothetical protein
MTPSPTQVLVITHDNDMASMHVTDRIKARGAAVHTLNSRRLVQAHQATLRFGFGNPALEVDGLSSFDRVWFRRLGKPAGHMSLHHDDRPFAEREAQEFALALLSDLGGSCQWFNEPARAIAAENKARQLAMACSLGLSVPHTAMTSSKQAVLSMFEELSTQHLIYKPFRVGDWIKSGSRIGRTCLVTAPDLPSVNVMRACPGIFQERIDKAFEIRTLLLGEFEISVSLNSKDYVDWREAGFAALSPRPCRLERSVHAKCVELLKLLGIRMGAFDFIVTPEGETVFLEVNQQGEFVMMDLALPELHVLDSFCDFLLG